MGLKKKLTELFPFYLRQIDRQICQASASKVLEKGGAMNTLGIHFLFHILPVVVGAATLLGLRFLFSDCKWGRSFSVFVFVAIPLFFFSGLVRVSVEPPPWSIARLRGDYWRMAIEGKEQGQLVISKNHLKNHKWAEKYKKDFKLAKAMENFKGQVSFGSSAFIWVRKRSLAGLELFAASRQTGNLIWRQWLRGNPLRVPEAHEIVGNRCFVHVGWNRVYCLNANTGKICWSKCLAEGWFGRNDVIATTGFVTNGDRLFVGVSTGAGTSGTAAPQGGYILSLDQATGRELRRIELIAPIKHLLGTTVNGQLWLAACLFDYGKRRRWIGIREDGQRLELGFDRGDCDNLLFIGAKELGQEPIVVRTVREYAEVALKVDWRAVKERDIRLLGVVGKDFEKKILVTIKNQKGNTSLQCYKLSGLEKLWEYDDEDLANASFYLSDKGVTVIAKCWYFTCLRLGSGRVKFRTAGHWPKWVAPTMDELRYESRHVFLPVNIPNTQLRYDVPMKNFACMLDGK